VVPAVAAAQAQPRLSFAEDDTLIVSVEKDATTAEATVVVVNSGAAIDALSFSAVSDNADAAAVSVEPSEGSAMPANSAARVGLSLTSNSFEDFSGHLVVATDGATAERDLEIAVENDFWFRVNAIIFGSLLIAAVFVAVRAATLRSFLGHHLGQPSWEFSKSWASTFTVVGALLGTILSSLVLPDTPERFSKETLAGMNLIFGVAILLAPIIFSATEGLQDVTDPAKPGVSEKQPQGTVRGYLIASAVTLGAVIGQLITIFFLLSEIEAKGDLPQASLWLLLVMLAITLVLTLRYAWRTMGWTAEHRTKESKAPPGMTADEAAAAVGPPLESWRVL
jgi:hypothetical protein